MSLIACRIAKASNAVMTVAVAFVVSGPACPHGGVSRLRTELRG